jgi:phospholipase C
MSSHLDDTNAPAPTIQHVVVLMMENHSFDHLLGWLPGIGELRADDKSNQDADGNAYHAAPGAGFVTGDPAHRLTNITLQIFGTPEPAPDDPPGMSGFVLDYESRIDPSAPGVPMVGYSPADLPVMTALARSFTTCTRWFCAVPGPTGPNRIFASCASSAGYAGPSYAVGTFPAEMARLTSIFGVLAAGGHRWGVYHEDPDFAVELLLDDVQAHPEWQHVDPGFETFHSHIQAGTLPSYAFLTPSLWTNSQHPPCDVRYGECVIANVYEAIANSSYWEKTLFVVTYDEHGGFYDSVPTPVGVPSPDGRSWDASRPPDYRYAPPPFAFDRLGPRVPALLISPYVLAGPDGTQYEHASIVATVLEIFGLDWPVPNQRIATVSSFKGVVGGTLRTGLPTRLARPPAGGGYTPLPPLVR